MAELKRYYQVVEVVFILMLTTMLLLFGLSFLATPSASAFRAFELNGIRMTPMFFAGLCFVFMLFCPFLLSPYMRARSMETRQFAAMFVTFPFLFYLLLMFFIMVVVQGNFNLTPIFYFSNYILMILVPIALYQGYHRRIEVASTFLLCVILILIILALVDRPLLPVLNGVNARYGTGITVFHIILLSALSILGYLLMLFPLRRFPCRLRRLLFLVFETPIAIIAFATLDSAVANSSSAVIPALAFINLGILVTILGYALCPTGRRLLVSYRNRQR